MPEGTTIWVPAVLIIVGIIGIVIPVIPGLLLALLGVLLWAYETGGQTAWTVFGVALVIYAVGVVTQYLIPGKRLRAQGVATSTLLVALLIGIVGMFVVPIIGFVIGFVAGIFLMEQLRSRDLAEARARTKHALIAVATSMGIELVVGMLIATTWVVGVSLTR